MDFAVFHPYVLYATRYPFSKGQSNNNRHCYSSSLYLITEGRGIVRTCGRRHITDPGSLVYIPAGQPHDWIADNRDPMVHVCCYFDWAHVDRRHLADHPSVICYDMTQLNPSYVGPAFPYAIPEFMRVEKVSLWSDWFEKFYTGNQYENEHTYMRSVKTQSQFLQFIEYFLAFALQDEAIPDHRMNKLLQRLDQDILHGKLRPLKAYYEELRISRGYFFELFKRSTGLPPTQYINQFRIHRAKEDLRNTDISITEIAEKFGFSSIHYFSKLFRQLNGLSPLEYRKHQMEADD
ncbi:AraC family transcriptional regulator [Bacillus sp. FSL K6-6540]|uniref:AraC family transcriptional regulator n=1 Tax=Bacillus sp. FSL K6-6540 TaxID=2921512 RepID=UPI0030F7D4EF